MDHKLTPLKIKNNLAGNPTRKPLFSATVKKLNGESLQVGDPRATRALVALMNQHAVNGGAACHWGGPAAFAEILSGLHALMFADGPWSENFNFVNDAGHAENGIYALRANLGFDDLSLEHLRGFRSLGSKLTGHGEAHVNPEGVFISNGPLGSGLPQAQGLAIADKLLNIDRITVCAMSDGACMEGEAKEAFSAIAGLHAKGKLNPFLLIISDNNTKLSGRIDADSFDMSPTFDSMQALGWNVIKQEKGNDLQASFTSLETALQELKANPERPICLHFKTVKGFGVKSTEESSSGGHGFPLKPFNKSLKAFINEIYNNETPVELLTWAQSLEELNAPTKKTDTKGEVTVVKEKVQVGFAKAVIEMAENNYPVYSLTSDLQGSTGIKAFHSKFPDRFIDLGIAESNMVSAAIGLSKAGIIPIVDTFAQFGVTKGNLPFIMASLSQAPVIALFSHIGFQDAADGASHQSTTYLAAIAAIPNVTAITCSCSEEAYHLMKQAIAQIATQRENNTTANSVVFFLGRENHSRYYKEEDQYKWGKMQVLKEGKDGVIVTSGPMLPHTLEACEQLNAAGIFPTIINNSFSNKPDTATLLKYLPSNQSRLLTVEDHQMVGGMGQMLAAAVLPQYSKLNFKQIGIDGKFGRSAYQAGELYQAHGMDATAQITAFKQLMEK